MENSIRGKGCSYYCPNWIPSTPPTLKVQEPKLLEAEPLWKWFRVSVFLGQPTLHNRPPPRCIFPYLLLGRVPVAIQSNVLPSSSSSVVKWPNLWVHHYLKPDIGNTWYFLEVFWGLRNGTFKLKPSCPFPHTRADIVCRKPQWADEEQDQPNFSQTPIYILRNFYSSNSEPRLWLLKANLVSLTWDCAVSPSTRIGTNPPALHVATGR